MKKVSNIDKLNEAITVAEKVLDDIENENNFRVNRKRKRVTKALEDAYQILNSKDYTEKKTKNATDGVWHSLVDDDPVTMMLLFLVGFSLSGIMLFTVYQTYSFLNFYLDKDSEPYRPILTEEISSKIKVDYNENNVVSLFDQMSVEDAIGLQGKPQKFTISNDSKDIGKENYIVKYAVYLEPLNGPQANLLKENHIKLKYTYTDSNGVLRESKIMTLGDLSKNAEGSLLLVQDEQPRDSKTDFDVYFWISSQTTDEEQDATYTLKFKVEATIGQA